MSKSTSRPSILHVTQATSAGVPAAMRQMIADQRSRGWQVVLAAPPDEAIPAIVESTGVAFHSWPATRNPGPTLFRETKRLREIVKRVQPDVVHLHSSKAGLVGRLVVRGRITTVFHPQAWSFLAVGGPTAFFARWWERLGARWLDLLICGSSDELRHAQREHIRPRRTVVITNAVDTDKATPASPRQKMEIRERLGLPTGPLVVCVGRLCHQKGQDLLLDSWSAVEAEVPNASLVLVGDGPLEAELRASAPQSVRFAGWQDNVADWMDTADVIVQPSRYEGLSLVTLEALARGRPLVAFAVEGMAEAIGDAGEVVTVNDTAALAAALRRRLLDPGLCDREGTLGRARAIERFSLGPHCDRIAQETLDALAARH